MRGLSGCWRATEPSGHQKAQERPQRESEDKEEKELKVKTFCLASLCLTGFQPCPARLPLLPSKAPGGGPDPTIAGPCGHFSPVGCPGLAQNNFVKFAFF